MFDWLVQYGYPLLFLGTVLEGETVLVTAGLAASRGYLDLRWVIAVAFIGSLIGDQIFFYIGRTHGRAFLARKPLRQAKADRVQRLMERHQIFLMVSFRFLYGLRMITPLFLGTCRINPRFFLAMNALGALLWSCFFAVGGYLFGDLLHLMLGDLRHIQRYIFAGVLLAGFLFWIYLALRRIRERRLLNGRGREK